MRAIDMFAGWGGFSLGAEQAGADVVWAGNHWPLAVRAHELNHPRAAHVCQDLRQADWSTLPPFDLLLASPACQGHSQAAQPSRARSGRTRRYHDALRATAWAVVDCADATEPAAFAVENVPDFARWRLYPQWLECLSELGYQITQTVVRATTCGVPQRRDRLFVVGSRVGPIHLDFAAPRREPAFGRCIDWRSGRWRPVTAATGAARARLEAARERFGKRALVQHVTGHRGIPLSEPIRTITTGDQWAVLNGDRYRPLTIRENARAMGFPDSYGWPVDAKRRDMISGLGNAVCPPVARRIIERIANAS